MLSTILPTADSSGALNRITANQQYRILTEQLAASGKCIYMADMDPDEPNIAHNWIALGADIGGDGIHPKYETRLILCATSTDTELATKATRRWPLCFMMQS